MYYPAGEAAVLTARLGELLASPAARASLEQAARGQAATFTWDQTRDRTIAELQAALA
jgi:hypothetical protein